MFRFKFSSLIIFAMFIAHIAANGSQSLKREKRSENDRQSILQDLVTDVDLLREEFSKNNISLHEEFSSNKELLLHVEGFLKTIGFGHSPNNRKPCEGRIGSKEWRQLTPLKCVRILKGLHTFSSASEACSRQFQRETDIDHPQVLTVDSQQKNEAVVNLLSSTTLTSIWIDVDSRNYSNWAAGSPKSVDGNNCTEMRNWDGQLGKWADVECERVNSVICEKTVPLSYAQMVQKVIQLTTNARQIPLETSAHPILREIETTTQSNLDVPLESKFSVRDYNFNMWPYIEYILRIQKRVDAMANQIQVQQKNITDSKHKLDWVLRKRDLEAVHAATLSHTLYLTSSVYDGDDSIYIFGGQRRNEIYLFNISSNTLTKVGFLPANLRAGATIKNTAGSLLFFGGRDDSDANSNKILELNTRQNTLKEVGRLQSTLTYGTAIKSKTNSSLVLLVGRSSVNEDNEYARGYNVDNFTNWGKTKLKQKYDWASAFVHDDDAFIFKDGSRAIEILNLKTLNSVIRETTLPNFVNLPAVVSDGKFGYIIGGYDNSTASPMDALIRFEPNTFQHEFVRVKNFPVAAGSTNFYYTSAVYVDKLNRIYIIGGSSSGGSYDKIWYIELGPRESISTAPAAESPGDDIFICANKLNGFYPYPDNSTQNAKFIACYNGIPEVLFCPPSLYFNSKTSTCEYPSIEDEALITCENKTNGMHPHPNNCELFLGCQDGFLDVFKCPSTLRFDEISLKCTFPEIVNCVSGAF